MRLLALDALTPSNSIPIEGMVCHDVRNPVQRSEVLVRKGSLVRAAEVEALPPHPRRYRPAQARPDAAPRLHVRTEASVHSVAAAYRRARADGADLILAAGAAATDPLDVMFEGLRSAGGEVDQIGIPAEPGTACWFGRLDGRPVLGLASCELFGRPGALDLLLPRMLAGAPLDADLVQRLALGGLLVGGPARIGPYHVSEGA